MEFPETFSIYLRQSSLKPRSQITNLFSIIHSMLLPSLFLFLMPPQIFGVKIEKYRQAQLAFPVQLKNEAKTPRLIDCFDLCQVTLKEDCDIGCYCRQDQTCQYGKWGSDVKMVESDSGRMIFLTSNRESAGNKT